MSEHLMYLATDDGVLTMRRIPGNWEEVAVGLNGQRVTSLAHRPGRPAEIFAGSYGGGLFFSADAGQIWQPRDQGLTFPHLRSILVDPTDVGRVLVGTEPAAVFRSEDGGQTWQELTSVRQLPGHERWFLPYSPRAGAVRTLAAVPGLPGSFYGGIEQGGVIFTADGGDSWQLLDGGVNEDVHQVLVDADGGVTLYAATGGGVYRSFDGGKSWDPVIADYTRAVAQRPGHPAIVFAGPALRVGHEGRIEQSHDQGSTWHPWTRGLQIPMKGMVDQFVTHPGDLDDLGGLFAVTTDGQVLHCDLDRPDWVPLFCDGVPHVNAIDIATDGNQK